VRLKEECQLLGPSTEVSRIPQKVVPKVNHWIPDARANSVGVLERIRPAKPPTSIPDIPLIVR